MNGNIIRVIIIKVERRPMPKIIVFLERHYEPLLASEFWEGRVHRGKVSSKSISTWGHKERINSEAKSEFAESCKC